MFVRLILLLLQLCTELSTQKISTKEFSSPIEKLFLRDDRLFVGTVNALHQLSSFTLNESQSTFIFAPTPCHCENDFHWKIFQPVDERTFLVCGTASQGVCQLIDEHFRLIINSSMPVVANDQTNSSVALILPEKNLIYFGVTFTNDGVYRWQIPSIAGRSLNQTRFMGIVSAANDDEFLSRDDLAVRFMPRQQTSFIVQYLHAFQSKDFLYFLTRQPNEFEPKSSTTKIVRFCRENSNSILRSYAELPLICVNADWILKSAEVFLDRNDEEILVGHFTRKEGNVGTTLCSWNVRRDIDRAFEETYRQCYSMGIGQRGLTFIKPNEICRRDESWAMPTSNEQFCSAMQTDRLPYPVGGTTPLIGRLFYEHFNEMTSALKIVTFGEKKNSFLLLQGLNNGTLKMALLDDRLATEWFYSNLITDGQAIHSEILFDSSRSILFLGGKSKIFRLSFADDCSSRSSCDQCLSSSSNVFCGWCSTSERCTLMNECATKLWQKTADQCSQIVSAQPLNASVDQSQWINLTFSKLPSLEHNEIYQCIFTDGQSSLSSQAIKLDHNRLSCPTPSSSSSLDRHRNSFFLSELSPTIVRLSVIKWPSNTTIATIPEFTFYNCSTSSSCLTCRSQIGCQWCSQRCSSMCSADASTTNDQCSSFALLNDSNVFLEAEQSASLPLKIDHFRWNQPIECRLNETSQGLVQSDQICRIAKVPSIESNENEKNVVFNVYQNDVALGLPVTMRIYRCEFYDRCDQCEQRSTCQWCEGRCQSQRRQSCSTNERCTSLRIVDFSPPILPLRGQTIVTISLNEPFNEHLRELTLADVPCAVLNVSDGLIRCRAAPSDSARQGKIRLRFDNSVLLLSKETIEYRQPVVKTLSPRRIYEYGGQTLHLTGDNLLIGNQQKLFVGQFQCVQTKSIGGPNLFTCRLPAMTPGVYNVTLTIDDEPIPLDEPLVVTANPSVQDIDPTVSFASGGRLVTVRGMYFSSAQSITVQFSHENWNAKLRISSQDISSSADGLVSSFQFRTPNVPHPSLPVDVAFSLHFDETLFSIGNLIQFHYVPDVLLNVSSIPPTLPYTGEELKLHVENLTEAASMSDIQLFIGCAECRLKTFTSKGITCQPPTHLATNTAIVLNPNQHEDCSPDNSTIGPIRFRIGYREYLIGYLSYSRSFGSKYSLLTIISLIFTSGLLTIALITLALCLFLRFRKAQSSPTTFSMKTTRQTNDPPLWTTDTSASTGPYYQVYEQISCSSSHENTLTRAPLLFCPHYAPPIIEHYPLNSLFLTSLSIDEHQLKQLLFNERPPTFSPNHRRAMEFFYDLLHMKPFAQAFIDQLIVNNSSDLLQSYAYLFRFNPSHYQSFPMTREISFFRFVSTLFQQNKNDLLTFFHFFDDFLRIFVDFLDAAPTDQLLRRAANSISASTLLLYPLQYRSFQLTIDYEHFLRFHLSVLDCDTIDQIKEKILRYFNSHEKTSRLMDEDQVDLLLPPLSNVGACSHQMPMIRNYFLNSTIRCQKKTQWNKSTPPFLYHLCQEEQLITDPQLINERLKENIQRVQPILLYFYQQIANGLELFAQWANQHFTADDSTPMRFHLYIQLVSELIRRLNRLMCYRTQCPILQSSLDVIADGLEYLFETKTEFSSEIDMLFADEKKQFVSFDKHHLHFPPTTRINASLTHMDIRSLILADETAIDCLMKLYQFYEIYSEPINQHIGENHVSVLLPVHHLLVQIRQYLKSDPIVHDPTLI